MDGNGAHNCETGVSGTISGEDPSEQCVLRFGVCDEELGVGGTLTFACNTCPYDSGDEELAGLKGGETDALGRIATSAPYRFHVMNSNVVIRFNRGKIS